MLDIGCLGLEPAVSCRRSEFAVTDKRMTHKADVTRTVTGLCVIKICSHCIQYILLALIYRPFEIYDVIAINRARSL